MFSEEGCDLMSGAASTRPTDSFTHWPYTGISEKSSFNGRKTDSRFWMTASLVRTDALLKKQCREVSHSLVIVEKSGFFMYSIYDLCYILVEVVDCDSHPNILMHRIIIWNKTTDAQTRKTLLQHRSRLLSIQD